jgi:hypothetical protein
MRSLSDVVGISANRSGQFKLSIQTQRIKADTVWSNLTNPNIGNGGWTQFTIAYTCHKNNLYTKVKKRLIERATRGNLTNITHFLSLFVV